MSARGSRRTRIFLGAAAGAVVLVVLAYANHLDNGFHFDDAHVIENNLFIRSLSNAPRFFTDASTFSTLPDHQTYRPVVSLTLALDYARAGGLEPRPFQVTQLLLHLLVGVGLFAVFLRVMDRSREGPANRYLALFGALWFCLHTGNTETVNYLSSRSDILSTLGIVGSLAVYLYAPGLRRFYVYLIPMVVGAMAKTPAVMFAPLLLSYVLLFEEEVGYDEVLRPESGAKVWGTLLRVAPALLVGVAVFFFVEGMNPEAQNYGSADRWGYLRTQPWVWLHYLRLFVLPVGLSADTDWDIIRTWADTRVLVGAASLLLLAWLAVEASRRRTWRPVAFGLTWFALGLLPSSSLFPLAEVANEHRVYLPFAGLTLAATWGLMQLARQRATAVLPVGWAVAGLVLLGAHVAGTVVRNRVWLDEESLWADVVQKSPENGRAWMNHGLTQMEQGRLEEARSDFLTAAELWPYYATVRVNLGIVTNALGDTAAADAYFRQAMDMDADYGPAHHFYGEYLIQAGRAPEAINYLRSAMEIMPAYAPTRHLLLETYYVIGSQEEVANLAQSTLGLAGDDAVSAAYRAGDPPVDAAGTDPYDQGVNLTAQGRHLEAGVAYRKFLETSGPDAGAYLNLGWSQAQIGFDALAAISFQQALAMRPGWDMAQQNLAWVQERMARQPTG